jgi:biotin operon repressor
MNPPEFRLLAIWQSVVEMKNVRLRMLAYRKIASQVGISDRSVRENIKKLVEQGYLVEENNWYALNRNNDFIQYIIRDFVQIESKTTIEFEIPARGSVVFEEGCKYEMPRAKKSSFGEVFGSVDTSRETSEQCKKSIEVCQPALSKAMPSFAIPKYQIDIDKTSISKFHDTFGNDAEMAIDFFKKEILKTQKSN